MNEPQSLNEHIRSLLGAGYLNFDLLNERARVELAAIFIKEYPTACFIFGTPPGLAEAASTYFRGIANYGRPSPLESGKLARVMAEGLLETAYRDIRQIWAIERAKWESADDKPKRRVAR